MYDGVPEASPPLARLWVECRTRLTGELVALNCFDRNSMSISCVSFLYQKKAPQVPEMAGIWMPARNEPNIMSLRRVSTSPEPTCWSPALTLRTHSSSPGAAPFLPTLGFLALLMGFELTFHSCVLRPYGPFEVAASIFHFCAIQSVSQVIFLRVVKSDSSRSVKTACCESLVLLTE